MGPSAASALPDDLMEEILVRIPPSDPATLARAAVAWKQWCRLVASPGFRRRYRDRHCVPPTLGYFCDHRDGDGFSTSFVHASSFRPCSAKDRELRPEDARHGRVLLRISPVMFGIVLRRFGLVVWYPVSGHRVVLPTPKGFCDKWNWRAKILCAAASRAGSCDHLNCHRGHFTVVLIGNYPNGMLSSVYTSQTGAWSKITYARHLSWACRLGEYNEKQSAHVGNALYYMLYWGNKILKYDLGAREFSVMEPPPLLSCEETTHSESIHLTTMEDGQLGLVVLRQSTLYILSTDQEFGWGGTKIIDLEKCSNYIPSTIPPFLIGFAGGSGLVSMNAGDNGILSVDIQSAQVKVFYETACISRIVPYIYFCTPVMAVRKGKDGPRVSASSSGQTSMANKLPNQAMGVPSKDDRPRAGALSNLRSGVASSLLSQANGTGGRSQQLVGGHRARAVGRLQPRFQRLQPIRPARFSGPAHSPPPQGPCFWSHVVTC